MVDLSNTTLIIDSNSLAYIAKYSMRGLSWNDFPTGVIFGFFSQLKELANHFQTNKFIFSWDSKKSFRRGLYPEYKAQRRERRKKRTDQEVIEDNLAFEQFYQLRRIFLPKFGFKNIFIRTGYESDDIMASLVINTPKELSKDKLIIVTTDDDLFQVLNRCDLYHPSTKRLMTKKSFEEEFEINPLQWVEIKQLAGCTSDNVKGIEGVGEKTALKYLKNLLKSGKIYARILKEKEKVIKQNAPLVCLPFAGVEPEEGFKIEKESFFSNDFCDICDQLGFKSFLKQDEYQKWVALFDMK